jgi:hypothetical protein
MELVALLIAVAIAWYWLDSMKARDIALGTGERACAAEGVQFLDWTVARERIGLGRDDAGRLHLMRVYRFEFSRSGNDRLDGAVTLLGGEVVSLHLAKPPTVVDNVIPLRRDPAG